ncbi:MAG: endo-1,4-beta-xylanase [Kineosporiaceae bacterium]
MIRKSGLTALVTAGAMGVLFVPTMTPAHAAGKVGKPGVVAPAATPEATPTASPTVTSSPTASPTPTPTPTVTLASPSLKALAARTGMAIGNAVSLEALAEDPNYAKIAATEFDSVTPENVMKWDATEPERGQFTFAQADAFMKFAETNKQKVRGHTLLWHSQVPAWVTEGTWTKAELTEVMRQHISAVAGRYKGRIWQWDVLNEAFNEDGTYRDTIWYRVIGPEYVQLAFKFAHEADPKALLFYNDYNIEGVNPKSDAVYAMVKQLKAKKIVIHGVGVQGHLSTEYDVPGSMPANLARFAKLGLFTAVTEADVRSVLPMTPAKRQAQAAGYNIMLASCLAEKKCISFTLWGFTDKYQWVPGVFTGEGYAALYDENYQSKPATDAVRLLLTLAPSGKPRGVVKK